MTRIERLEGVLHVGVRWSVFLLAGGDRIVEMYPEEGSRRERFDAIRTRMAEIRDELTELRRIEREVQP